MRFLIIIFLNVISICCYSQNRDDKNKEKETIYLQPTPSMEMAFKSFIMQTIQLTSLRYHPMITDTINNIGLATDKLDSVKIRLKSGTEWDPTQEPPQAKFLLIKTIFKKLDSADYDRINYLKIISAYEDKKDNTNKMIDYLFFRMNYYNSENVIKMTIDFIVKPDENGELILFDRKIVNGSSENN